MTNRLTVYDEGLPLPPLIDFAGFQKDVTHPFMHDLDGKTGFAERVRFTLPERANIQVLHFDNRGDTLLYPGFPADVLYEFRLVSLGTQLVLWATIGLVFATLARRLLLEERVPA